MKKVAIIGGGITGLSAAYAIKGAIENGQDIDYIILEKNSYLGGKILTERTDDGFVIEGGPDCFISYKPWMFDLSRKLGCEDKLIGSNDEVRKNYILVGNKLRRLPEGIMMMVPTKIMPFIASDLFSLPGKMRMAMDFFIPKKKEPGDETLASFVKRRLGKEALDRLAEPLVAGIHAGNPETMSLAATFPTFLDMEQKHGGLIKAVLATKKSKNSPSNKGGKPGEQGAGAAHGTISGGQGKPGATPDAGVKKTLFMTFKGGMQDIIDELHKALDKNKIFVNTEVSKVQEVKGPDNSSSYILDLADGRTIEVDAIIMASPSHDTANLICDIDKPLADVLSEIPQVSSATVSLAYRKKDIKHDLKGFGFIVPLTEDRKIKACTWSSSKFTGRVPNDEYVILRVFVGGAKNQELTFLSDDELELIARAELKDIMEVDANPINRWIFRWPKGMPQYTIGHLDRLRRIDERVADHPGMFLAGGSYREVGTPDCINSGTKAAEAAMAYLSNET